MRHYVATFLPRDSKNLFEIGKNLQQLWSVGKFKQAEIVCQRQYEFIREIEKKLPPNIRYHKGDTLYNWGISLVGQADRDAEFLGVFKFILAYIEDLFDHDNFEFANILPAARARTEFPGSLRQPGARNGRLEALFRYSFTFIYLYRPKRTPQGVYLLRGE